MFMITVCKLREEQESVMLLIIEGAKACTSTHILFTKAKFDFVYTYNANRNDGKSRKRIAGCCVRYTE